jgi:hypothetical protein
MKDNKKKLIVVGALALLIVCVGAFQFLSGSSSPPPPAAVAKKDVKKVADPTPVEPAKNPLFSQNLPARDPFTQPASMAPKPVTPAPAPQPKETRQPSLPPMEINTKGGFGNAPLTVQPDPEAKFGFTLSGVMLGQRPMAVFTDSQGNQRLILLGGSIDPDTKVISIEKDAVTVRFHGKTLRLTVEGNPNAK